jgi:nitroimidazol reductase NimA-like FMN-containing flavoprotein (pyridoxamine 5'-phosphate oxidase superfamily)
MKPRRRLPSGTIIRRLLSSQKLGVLATREARTPYQSLVAFAASADLKHIYFATESKTRKHTNLLKSPEVSMLFDNRGMAEDDFNKGIAVTALGKAEAVKSRSLKKARQLYLEKHPSLAGFLKSPTCRMFQIRVKTYFLVTEFQRVAEYKPVG